MNEDKYKYLGKNVILFMISTFTPKLLSLLIVPLYTRKLSTIDYGTVDLMVTTAGLLAPVFTLNIMEAIVPFTMKSENKRHIFSIAFQIVNFGSLLLLALILIVRQFNLFSYSGDMYIFLFLYYYLSVIGTSISNYLRGIDRVSDMVVYSVIHSALLVLFNLCFLVVFDWGVQGYMLSLLLSQFISILFVFIHAKLWKHIIRIEKKTNELRIDMIRYSAPLIFNTLIWWVNNSSDKYILTFFWGASVNGIYSMAYKIPTILSSFSSVFGSAWTLSAIKEYDKDDSDHFFSNGYAVYNAGLTIVCGIIIILAKPIAYILFANEYFEAWKYSGFLLISSLFSALSSYYGSIFAACRDSKNMVYSTMLSAIVNIILNLALIPFIGAMGAAIATMASYAVMWFNRMLASRKHISLHVNIGKNIVGYLLLLFIVIWNIVGFLQYLIMIMAFACIIIIYYREARSFINAIFVKARSMLDSIKR